MPASADHDRQIPVRLPPPEGFLVPNIPPAQSRACSSPLEQTPPETQPVAQLENHVGAMLSRAVNSTRPAPKAPTREDPADTKTLLLSVLSGLGTAALASQAGGPLLGAALTYGLAGLAAFALGRHVQSEESRVQVALDQDRAKAQEIYQAVLGLFSKEQQDILEKKLEHYADDLDLRTFILNLQGALQRQHPSQSLEALLASLPIKDWVRAAKHREAIDQAANLQEQCKEIASLRKKEWAQGLLAFFQLVTPMGSWTHHLVSNGLSEWLTGTRQNLGNGLKAYEQSVTIDQCAKTAQQLGQWVTAPALETLRKSVEKGESEARAAKFEYNNAVGKGGPDSQLDVLQTRQRALTDRYRSSALNLQIAEATDPTEKDHLRGKLEILQKRQAAAAAARVNPGGYQAQVQSELFDIPIPPAATSEPLKAEVSAQTAAATAGPATSLLQTAANGALILGIGMRPELTPLALAMAALNAGKVNAAPVTPPLSSAPLFSTEAAFNSEPLRLNNQTQAAEQASLAALQAQTDAYLGSLDTAQQSQFLQLTRRTLGSEMALAEKVQLAEQRFETEQLRLFTQALEDRFDQPIDPKTTFFVSRHRSGASEDVPSKFDQVYTRKISLWEAAKGSFNWPSGPEDFSNSNTRIMNAAGKPLTHNVSIAGTRVTRSLPTESMTGFIRGRNLGAVRNEHFKTLEMSVQDQTTARTDRWQLERLDYSRRYPQATALPEGIEDLKSWQSFKLALGSGAKHQGEETTVALPLFLFQQGGHTFSYLPGRPEGAIRQHFSPSAAITDLNQQIRADAQSGKLGWLLRILSEPDKARLNRFMQTQDPIPDTAQLNPVARFLYDKFGTTPKNHAQELTLIDSTPPARTLVGLGEAVDLLKTERLRADWNNGFRTTGQATLAGLNGALTHAIGEVLEMLSLPLVPLGMNRVMQSVMLASLGYQTGSAGIELLKGNRQEAVQAAGDLFDLMVSGKLQGYASTLNGPRSQALIRAMQLPGRGFDPHQKGLWWQTDQLDLYLEDSQSPLKGVPDSNGVYRQGQDTYVQMQHEGHTRYAKVRFDSDIQAYRLSAGPAGSDRPPVRRDPVNSFYQVDTQLTVRSDSNEQLLHHMLPASLQTVGFTHAELKQVLDTTLVSRSELQAAWKGNGAVPVGLMDALAELKLRKEIEQSSVIARTSGAVPTAGQEPVLWSVLANLLNAPLIIQDANGNVIATYRSSATPENEAAVRLTRIRDGEYRPTIGSAAEDTPNADSLWRSALKEYESQHPQSTLGRNEVDNSFEGRLATLKAQAGQHIERHRRDLYHVLLAQQPQSHWEDTDSLRTYAPVEAAYFVGSDSAAIVRRLYPDLSRSTVQTLLARHPAPTTGLMEARHQLPLPLKTACDQAQRTTLFNRALASLSDVSISPLTLDSEKLLLTALTAFEQLNVAVQVHDPAGNVLAVYGDKHLTEKVTITRGPHGQYFARSPEGDQIPGQAGANPLTSALLQAMNDAQRTALGIEIFKSQKLADKTQTFYSRQWTRGVATNQISDSRIAVEKDHIKSYRSKVVIDPKAAPDARGIYTQADKSYVMIGKHSYQVKVDMSDFDADSNPVIRLVKPGSPAAQSTGAVFNPGMGYGYPVTRLATGEWITARTGLLGGAPLRRTPSQIIQQTMNLNPAEAQQFLDNFKFPDDPSSMFTPLNMALALESSYQVPEWAMNYWQPPAQDLGSRWSLSAQSPMADSPLHRAGETRTAEASPGRVLQNDQAGLPGGAPVLRTPSQIIQQSMDLNPAEAQQFLDNFKFPDDPSSLYTPLDLALAIESSFQLPDWAINYCLSPVQDLYDRWSLPAQSPMDDSLLHRDDDDMDIGEPPQGQSPQSPNSLDSGLNSPHDSVGSPGSSGTGHSDLDTVPDEINPVPNTYPVQLPPGAHLNRLGLIQSRGFQTLYRAISRKENRFSTEPTRDGFYESYLFNGVKKMMDGIVVITAATREGAEAYAQQEFADGYRLFEIDATGLEAVSLRENIDLNAEFLEKRERYVAGSIAVMKSNGRIESFGEYAALFQEVHVQGPISEDRVREI
jgi:hypothetical protein